MLQIALQLLGQKVMVLMDVDVQLQHLSSIHLFNPAQQIVVAQKVLKAMVLLVLALAVHQISILGLEIVKVGALLELQMLREYVNVMRICIFGMTQSVFLVLEIQKILIFGQVNVSKTVLMILVQILIRFVNVIMVLMHLILGLSHVLNAHQGLLLLQDKFVLVIKLLLCMFNGNKNVKPLVLLGLIIINLMSFVLVQKAIQEMIVVLVILDMRELHVF